MLSSNLSSLTGLDIFDLSNVLKILPNQYAKMQQLDIAGCLNKGTSHDS